MDRSSVTGVINTPTMLDMKAPARLTRQTAKREIWWSNAIFFVGMHLVALVGALWLSPWGTLRRPTMYLCICSWQMASFGITIGYHRLWSHKGFTARLPLRIVLAIMGGLGFQGSIKWWVLRHRLHHRFTDDPVHDPYSATHGLLYSHMGWIFWKPRYERLALIDKRDLERDPVVQFQHRHYIPIALFFGLLCPTVIAAAWGDSLGGFIWGGVIARLLIWHCTFMINSLAHWEGLQLYSKDISARGDFILAMLTSGEGNHNFHAFPQDFRNGPHPLDWDPTKWIIWLLHKYTPLVPQIRVTSEPDILKARIRVLEEEAESAGIPSKKTELKEKAAKLRTLVPSESWAVPESQLETWERKQLEGYIRNGSKKVLLIDGWIVDVTSYMKDHPGGASIMMKYSPLAPSTEYVDDSGVDIGTSEYGTAPLRDASAAFHGGLNNHSSAAVDKLRMLRIARLAA